MMGTIINTTITFIVSGILGYLLKTIKDYKSKLDKKTNNEILQNKALMTLLKNNLVSIYFVYNTTKQIPDYVYQNFLDSLEIYENLDGDGFIHNIAKKMESWEIIKTNIL